MFSGKTGGWGCRPPVQYFQLGPWSWVRYYACKYLLMSLAHAAFSPAKTQDPNPRQRSRIAGNLGNAAITEKPMRRGTHLQHLGSGRQSAASEPAGRLVGQHLGGRQTRQTDRQTNKQTCAVQWRGNYMCAMALVIPIHRSLLPSMQVGKCCVVALYRAFLCFVVCLKVFLPPFVPSCGGRQPRWACIFLPIWLRYSTCRLMITYLRQKVWKVRCVFYSLPQLQGRSD